jgi:Cu/Zn superoxide dismutase
MKKVALVTLLVACGGSKKPAVADEAPPVAEQPKEAAEPSEPSEPSEPPPPAEPAVAAVTGAKAALQPLKGAKQPPGTVTFSQQEGQDTNVTSDFQGLRPGTYDLVIHDGSECGANGEKAGGPWKGSEAVTLKFSVGRDQPGNIDETGVKLMLSGVAPIIGQTLMLHQDKKGKPGKAIACGTIDAVGS